MTPAGVVTVAEYVERFLDAPEVALGGLGRVARAFDQGTLGGFPEDFRRLVEEAALSLRPAAPVLASGSDPMCVQAAVEPILAGMIEGGGTPAYTYSWRNGEEDLFPCPYRHDPLILLPEKSRQEVLDEAMRSGALTYPLALESRSLSPWCSRRYEEALARAGGGWKELTAEIVVHELERVPRDGCPGERLMAANRSGCVFPVEDPADLARIVRVLRGGGPWPPVMGLVFIPVTPDELAAWRERPDIE